MRGLTRRELSLRISGFAVLALFCVQSASAGVPGPTEKRLKESLSDLHIPFVANSGQIDSAVAFYAPTLAGTVFVTRDGRIVYSLPAPRGSVSRPELVGGARGWTLTESVTGGRPSLSGGRRASTRVSYFLGNDPELWRSGLTTLEDISLGEVWPGIVLDLRANGTSVEKLFTVQPGGDPSRIRMSLAGALRLRTGLAGALIVSTGLGDVTLTPPVAYQERDGARRTIEVAYAVRGGHYGFRLGHYDPTLPVVIDPLLRATYLGGTGQDVASSLAIHPTSGDVYVAGFTYSLNFPGTAGGAQPANGGTANVFVARLNVALTAITQATYLGGSGLTGTLGSSIPTVVLAIHPISGEVYLAGATNSTNFPGTTGGAQAVASGGGADAFVARLNAALTTLGQATYLGGFLPDLATAIAIHPLSGEVYVAGGTSSSNFPGVAGGAQPAFGGGNQDGFVARLNAALTTLGQSSFLGGGAAEGAFGVAIHPFSGEVYVAGHTGSTNFPGTTGGAQAANAGGFDAFVTRLNGALTTLGQSTYLGGIGSDSLAALAIHPTSGEVYIAGATPSTNFPGTAGGAQGTNGGGFQDGFVARLNAPLTTLNQATYLGGNGNDGATILTFHPASGELYVAGGTTSTDFPGTGGGVQPAANLNGDAFVARLNLSLTALGQTTYLGGSGQDAAAALAIHPASGSVYVTGGTSSPDFPGTAGGAQPAFGGGTSDGFVARLSGDLAFRAQGDFNGDLSAEILWRNLSTGDNTIWLMNGNNFIGFGGLPPIPDQAWQIGGVGDLSGDGMKDIVWRNNTTGQNTIWVMNGAALATQIPLAAEADVNWRIRAIADFNGDGKADLLWRNIVTGANTIWLMNGSLVTSTAPVPPVPDVNWEIDGAADFDADGRPDILWRNLATGQNTIWLMNGSVFKGFAAMPPLADLNWRMVGVGDYTGDNQPDILWRNIATGQNTVWTMNTTQVTGAIPVPSVPDLNWRIAGPR